MVEASSSRILSSTLLHELSSALIVLLELVKNLSLSGLLRHVSVWIGLAELLVATGCQLDLLAYLIKHVVLFV